MLETLKQIKARLTKIQEKTNEGHAITSKVLASLQQYEKGMKDLVRWIEEGEALMKQGHISGKKEDVQQKVQAHFSKLPHNQKVLEEKNKIVQETIQLNIDYMDASPLESNISELNRRFQILSQSAPKMMDKLSSEVSSMQNFKEKASDLTNWLREAEQRLDEQSDDPIEAIKGHKELFGDHSNRLQEFVAASEELLQSIPEKDRKPLQQKIKLLQNKYKETIDKGPMKLCKLEFQLAESELKHNVDDSKNELDSETLALNSKQEPEHILGMHKEFFHESKLIPYSLDCLQEMESCVNKMATLDPQDKSLAEALNKSQLEWQQTFDDIQVMQCKLVELLEKWKEYNDSLNAVKEWTDMTNRTADELLKTSDPRRFEELQRELEELQNNAPEISQKFHQAQETIGDLAADSTTGTAQSQQQILGQLAKNQQQLQSKLSDIPTEVARKSKKFEQQAKAKNAWNWLQEKQKDLSEKPSWGDLPVLKELLAKQQSLHHDLEEAVPIIEEEVVRASQEQSLESVLPEQESVTKTLQATKQKSANQLKDLQDAVELWENYEKEKSALLASIDEVDDAIESSFSPELSTLDDIKTACSLLQRLIQIHKDLDSKESEVKSMNKELQKSAPLATKSSLEGDIRSIDEKNTSTRGKLNKKLQELENLDKKWSEYLGKKDELVEWQTKVEKQMDEITRDESTPDKVYDAARVVFSEIFDKYNAFEELDALLDELLKDPNKPDVQLLKEGLDAAQQDWQRLCAAAKALGDSLDAKVKHWQAYQNAKQQLLPWIKFTNKKLDAEPTVDSLKDAEKRVANFDVICEEIPDNQSLLDQVIEEAAALPKEHTAGLSQLLHDWETVVGRVQEKKLDAIKAAEAWQEYESGSNDMLELFAEVEQSLVTPIEESEGTPVDAVDGGEPSTQISQLQKISERWESKKPSFETVLDANQKILLFSAPMVSKKIAGDGIQLKRKWEKLEGCLEQCTDFERSCFDFEKWLQDMESALDNEKSSLDNLKEKEDRLQKLQDLQKSVTTFEPFVQSIQVKAEMVTNSCSYAGARPKKTKLIQRFNSITTQLKECHDSTQSDVNDHQDFDNSVQSFQDILEKIKGIYENNCSPTGDVKECRNKLQAIQNCLAQKNSIQDQVSDVIDKLQKVLPHTSPNGRGVLQQQVHTPKREWESCIGKLLEAETILKDSVQRWCEFEKKLGSQKTVMKEIEFKLDDFCKLKCTLQEKEEQVKALKAVSSDIEDHAQMISDLKELGEVINIDNEPVVMNNVSSELQMLQEEYDDLKSKVKSLLNDGTKNLKIHEHYEDTFRRICNLVDELNEAFADYKDLNGDKETIQHKLNKIQDLLKEKTKMDPLLDELQEASESTIISTASQARPAIQEDTTGAVEDCQSLQAQLMEAEQVFEEHISAWVDYEKVLDTLTQWIAEATADLEAIVQPQGDLKEKEATYEKCKLLEETIADKGQHVEQCCQLGEVVVKANSGSIDVPSQVEELKTNYETLLNKSKVGVRQLQENFANFQVFLTSSEEFTRWLDRAKEELSEHSSTTGENRLIEGRLAKIKSLLDEREEGQTLLNVTEGRLHTILSQTSPDGRSSSKQSVQTLKDNWQEYLTQLSQTHSILEGCLMSWKNYKQCLAQVEAWLDEMNEKLTEAEKDQQKVDLNAKRDFLGKCKALQEDISSFINVISLTEKAEKLEHSGSGDNITVELKEVSNRYEETVTRAQELVTRGEENVAIHQLFLDACQEFSDWLNEVNQKLQHCGVCTGSAEVNADNLVSVKDTIGRKPEGEAKLEKLKKHGEETMSETADAGKQLILEQMHTAEKELETFVQYSNESQHQLKDWMAQWEKYNDAFEAMSRWLEDMDDSLKWAGILQDALEGKRQQFDKYQAVEDEIIDQENEFSQVEAEAQTLVQLTNSTSTFITDVSQLLKKYDALQEKVKLCLDELEGAVSDHQVFEEHLQDYSDWFQDAASTLDKCGNVKGPKETVLQKAAKIKTLSEQKNDGEEKLNEIIIQADKVLRRTSAAGRDTIQHELGELQVEWAGLVASLTQASDLLDRALKLWSKLDRDCDDMEAWIREMEQKIKTAQDLQSTVKDKMNKSKSVTKLMDEVEAVKPDIKLLSDQPVQFESIGVDDPEVNNRVKELIEAYQKLFQLAESTSRKLQSCVNEHMKYDEMVQDATSWIKKTRQQATLCSTAAGDKNTSHEKLDKIQELLDSLSDGQSKIHQITEQAEVVLPETGFTGKDLLLQEVQAITKEFEILKQDLEKINERILDSANQWKEFGEVFADFEKWLVKADETIQDLIKPQDDLEGKKNSQDRVQTLSEDVEHHTSVKDELVKKAEGLIESNPGAVAMGSEAMKLANQFQSLQLKLKEAKRKIEKNFTDHRQYSISLDEFLSWHSQTAQKLQECSTCQGSRNEVVQRFHIVQDILSTRHKGQSLLNAVTAKGERILPHSSDAGKIKIQTELDTCKQQYNDAIDECSKLKKELEHATQLWNTYLSCKEKLESWMVDVDKQVECLKELKSTIAEKKVKQDRTKVLQNEAASHKKDHHSVRQASEQLVQLNPDDSVLSEEVSYLGQKYQQLLDALKDLCENAVEAVKDHQKYQKELQDLNDWLKDARQKVTMVSDTSGKKQVIYDKLAAAKELLDLMDQGKQLLDNVTGISETVLLNTADIGQITILNQLDKAKQDYNSLLNVLNTSKAKLENCAEQWDSYDTSKAELLTWMESYEDELAKGVKPQTEFQQKASQKQKFKEVQESIVAKQVSFETLSSQAQSLLETSAGNVGVASDATRMTTRFQKLVMKAKEAVRKSEQDTQNHEQYQNALQEFNDYMDAAEMSLNQNSNVIGDKNTCETRLNNLLDLSKDKKKGSSLLSAVVSISEKVLSATEPSGQQAIADEVHACKQHFKGYKTKLDESKMVVEDCLAEWHHFEELQNEVLLWIDTTEEYFSEEPKLKCSLTEKEEQLENCEERLESVVTHEAAVKKLSVTCERLCHMTGEVAVKDTVGTTSARYHRLAEVAKAHCDILKKRVVEHQDFNKALIMTNNWLQEHQRKLLECSCLDGDIEAVQTRLDHLQHVIDELSQGISNLDQSEKLAETVIPSTLPAGCKEIEGKLGESRHELEMLEANAEELKNKLEICRQQWQEFLVCVNNLGAWLSNVESMTSSEHQLNKDLEEKVEKEMVCKELLDDVVSHEEALAEAFEKSKPLLDTSDADASINGQLDEVSTRYHMIKEKAKEMLENSQKVVEDHKTYNQSLNEFNESLNEAEKKIKLQYHLEGSKQDVDARHQVVKDICKQLPENESKLIACSTKYKGVLQQTSDEGQLLLTSQMKDLQQRSSKHAVMAAEGNDGLAKRAEQWMLFEDKAEDFKCWLTNVEKFLADEPEKLVSLDEKKQQYEKYAGIAHEIENHKSQLYQVDQLAQELLTLDTGSTDVKGQLQGLQHRYEALTLKSKDVAEPMKTSIADQQQYHDALKEAECAVLQISKKLTSCNPVAEGGLEATQALVAQHQGTLRELAACGAQMEDLQSKAKSLALSARETPELEILMQEQLAKLDQTLQAVSRSANEIQAELQESMHKQQAFEEAVNKCYDWMQSIDNEMLNQPITTESLDDAQNQLVTTQEILDNAVSHQQLLSAAEDRIEVPADESFSNTRAGQVELQLNVLIETADFRLKEMNGQVGRWQQLVKKLDELKNWLADMATKIKDEESKPVDLEKPKARQAIQQLQELVGVIKGKNPEIQSLVNKYQRLSSVPNKDLEELQENMKNLEESASDLIKCRKDNLKQIEGYHKVQNLVRDLLEKTTKEFDMLQKETIVSTATKLEMSKKLGSDISRQLPSLVSLESATNEISPKLKPQEATAIKEHLKAESGKWSKHDEMAKQQTATLEVLLIDYKSFIEKAQFCLGWLKDVERQVASPATISPKVTEVESAVQRHKDLCNEIESKRALMQSLRERGDNMVKGLSQGEKANVQRHILQISSHLDMVQRLAAKKSEKLDACLRQRKEFWQRYNDCYQQLQEESKSISDMIPPKVIVEEIIKQIFEAKVVDENLKGLHEEIINVCSDGGAIIQDCKDVDKQELQQQLKGERKQWNYSRLFKQFSSRCSCPTASVLSCSNSYIWFL
ncbi:nesprin-1-like [Anneissia japonica]|uniref:nesprin-1-like n=1 Tax=Anneissia japonica TaxID=1529436 RepID=UPI00142565A2|nr:nesprin-1-like [Anneissia japonica]